MLRDTRPCDAWFDVQTAMIVNVTRLYRRAFTGQLFGAMVVLNVSCYCTLRAGCSVVNTGPSTALVIRRVRDARPLAAIVTLRRELFWL